MLKLYEGGAYLVNGNELIPDTADALAAVESKTGVKTTKEEAAKGTGNKKVGIVSRIIDVISAIFAPFLYTLAIWKI